VSRGIIVAGADVVADGGPTMRLWDATLAAAIGGT
jgi:hypothetical protein